MQTIRKFLRPSKARSAAATRAVIEAAPAVRAQDENRFGKRMFLGASAGCYKGAHIDVEAPYHEWLSAAQRQLDSHADLMAAAERAIAALAANGAPNCEAAKELRAAINKALGQ